MTTRHGDEGGPARGRPRGVDPAAALRLVLTSRSTRSRARVLDVACPRQHRLAAVYLTSAGPMVAGVTRVVTRTTTTVGGLDWEAQVEQQRSRSRAAGLVFPLADPPPVAEFQCRCTVARIPAAWWAKQDATAGRRRRVVWQGEAGADPDH